MAYSIGQLSKKFHIAASALRYYEKEGLLPGIKRNKAGIREFGQKEVESLILIDCLKQSGLSIKEISVLVNLIQQGDSTVNECNEFLDGVVANLESQIKHLKHNLKVLRYEQWRYRKAVELGSIRLVNELPNSQIPKKIRKTREKVIKSRSEE